MKISDKPKTTVIKAKTKSGSAINVLSQWWLTKDPKKAAEQLLSSASFLKESQGYRYQQAAMYAKLYGNINLYGFAGQSISRMDRSPSPSVDRPTFNLISSITDTVVSRMSSSRPKPVFLTDGGDYKQRILSKKLNGFIQGEFFRNDIYEKATMMLRDSCVEGTGILHVFENDEHLVDVERVLLTELLVDPNEAMYGSPRQLYRVKLVDREVLLHNFPDQRAKIETAASGDPSGRDSNGYAISDLVLVVEGWHLPSSKTAKDGRRMIACSSGFLLDEPYEKRSFPFVFLHYSPRMLGFWGQGVAERQSGTQLELNSVLWTISKAIKLVGVPRVFQEEGAKISTAHHTNDIGVVVKYRGTKPSYEVAPCNAPELYAERDRLIQYGYQSEGVSFMGATSQKPAGLNSGEAIRSYDDISADRFTQLARRYDSVFVDLTYKMVDIAKDIALREGKYSSVYPNKGSIQEIDLPHADIIENSYIVQCYTQSSLPKDPTGRLAKIAEMIESGMISIQEGRRLLDYPDIEQLDRLSSSKEERIFQILDLIVERGEYTPPDVFIDLELASTYTTQYINLYAQCKLDEDRMQMLREFFEQVEDIRQASMPPASPAVPQPNVPEAPVAPPPTQFGITSKV